MTVARLFTRDSRRLPPRIGSHQPGFETALRVPIFELPSKFALRLLRASRASESRLNSQLYWPSALSALSALSSQLSQLSARGSLDRGSLGSARAWLGDPMADSGGSKLVPRSPRPANQKSPEKSRPSDYDKQACRTRVMWDAKKSERPRRASLRETGVTGAQRAGPIGVGAPRASGPTPIATRPGRGTGPRGCPARASPG
jgi:hypothetical protein